MPVTIAAVLAWFLIRGGRNDPDHTRLKQVQADYERSQRER